MAVKQDVATASNVGYVLRVMRSSESGLSEQPDIRIFVQALSGEFVRLTPGTTVAAARGARGGSSLTTIVLRLEGVRGAVLDIRRLVAYQAVADTSAGAGP